MKKIDAIIETLAVIRAVMLSCLLCWPLAAGAQTGDELLTVSREGTSTSATSLEATREIQNSVIAEVAKAQVIELIGEKRYQKSRGVVESKIIRQAAKFVPFVNSGTPAQLPDGSWKMTVELKLSATSLRKMVLETGLLNDADGPASVLPLVAFVDRRQGTSLRWWLGEPKDDAHKFLSQLSKSVHERLQIELNKQGFHLIKPQGTQSSPLPELHRIERAGMQDLASISDYFNAPMVLKGDVKFRAGKTDAAGALCAVKLQVIQGATGRTIAEVSRQFEAVPGAYESTVRAKLLAEFPDLAKDLAVQVLEAWQRGTLNTSLVRLALRGSLTAKQLGEFKSSLMQSVTDVKTMKERLFEGDQVTLEVDFSGEAAPLVERLRALRLQAFETRLIEASERHIALDVRPRVGSPAGAPTYENR